jgi:hypothetical protein
MRPDLVEDRFSKHPSWGSVSERTVDESFECVACGNRKGTQAVEPS